MATHDTQPTARRTHPPLDGCIDAHASVLTAARRMAGEKTHHLIVLESRQILGVITDRDLVVRCVSARRHPSRTCVGDIMSATAVGAGRTDSSPAATAPAIETPDPTIRLIQAGKEWESAPAVASGPSAGR